MQRILSPFPHTGKEAARVCSLEPQEISGPTGDFPPREHTSTALLWITAQASRGSPGMLFRATSSGFSAISSGLPQSCTQQSGRVFSHLTWLGARGISAKLSSYITLEKPMLPAYTWGCQVVCRVGVQSNISSCSHTALWLEKGALLSRVRQGWQDLQHCPAGKTGDRDVGLSSSSLSPAGASLWVSFPGMEQQPPKTRGAGLRAEVDAVMQMCQGG